MIIFIILLSFYYIFSLIVKLFKDYDNKLNIMQNTNNSNCSNELPINQYHLPEIFEFVLIENGLHIYSSPDLNLVIHELLSITLNYLSFLKSNNIKFNVKNNTLHIDIFVKNINKRYPINYGTIDFSFTTYQFICSNNFNIQLKQYNLSLINKIKSLCSHTTQDFSRYVNKKIEPKIINNDDILTNKHDDIDSLLQNTNQLLINNKVNIDSNPFIIVENKENIKDNLNNDTKIDVSLSTNNNSLLDSSNVDQDLENKLEKEIERIELLKIEQEEKLAEIKDNHNKQKEDIADYVCEINAKKMMERIKLDNENQKRNIYNSDKKSYFQMKANIEVGKLKEENISPFFKQKYPIFKFMDENGNLDYDNDNLDYKNAYELYTELFNELYPKNIIEDNEDDNYVPHNYHYLTESEKKKYSKFIKKSKEKTIPSYDDLILELNDTDKDILINNCGVDPENINTDKSNGSNGSTDSFHKQNTKLSSLDEIKNIFMSKMF